MDLILVLSTVLGVVVSCNGCMMHARLIVCVSLLLSLHTHV